MKITKVIVKIELDKGSPRTYQMNLTAEPVERKSGGMSLAHFQPTEGNKVIKSFSKLYVDTAELAKDKANKEEASKEASK